MGPLGIEVREGNKMGNCKNARSRKDDLERRGVSKKVLESEKERRTQKWGGKRYVSLRKV